MEKNPKKQIVLVCSILVFALSTGDLFSQINRISLPDIRSEGNFYDKNGTLYVDAIVINFKDCVIDLPKGMRYATVSSIGSDFSDVRQTVKDFERKFGPIKIVKQIPDAQWGDVTRRHKITGELVQIHEFSQLFTIRFSSPIPLDSTISEFLKLPEVEYAHQPVSIVYFDEPGDPKFNDQWNLEVVDAVRAWDITHGSRDVRIGIVDDGVYKNHEDLTNKIDYWDGVVGDHGAMVAGVGGAETDNDKGVASLSWDISLYCYGGYNEIGDEQFAVQGILEATDSTDIINMSWGILRHANLEDMPESCDDPSKWIEWCAIPCDYQEIRDAVLDACERGVICIAAAGNASENNVPAECDPWTVPWTEYPAAYPDVIAVSATKLIAEAEQFREGWNYGNFVDVSAPGYNILTTDINGGYSYNNGTSFSAPLVCALAGLIKSVNPELEADDITNIIYNNADKIDSQNHPYDEEGWNEYLGYGRINAYQALKYTVENYGGTFTQDITIAAGDTFNLQPGVTLKFSENTSLHVYGTLIAEGTASQPITFTSTSGTDPGSWNNIYVNSSNNTFKWCEFEYGNWALKLYGNPDPASGNLVQNCTFHDNNQGLRIENNDADVISCNIYDNQYNLVTVNNTQVDIEGTRIHDGDRDGIYSVSGNLLNLL